MKKILGLAAVAAVLAFSSAADAHSLRLECKKTSANDVVCRTIMSDGEVARGVEVQLLKDDNYAVVATGKSDAAGQYAFKVPAMEYHVVATADKAHVASIAGTDIW
jgi:hypothetical protein